MKVSLYFLVSGILLLCKLVTILLSSFNAFFHHSDELQCENEPCKNGGTCTELDNGFDCTCPKGYRGKTCEGMRILVTMKMILFME